MNTRPIRNDDDLRAVLRCLQAVFQARAGTPEAEEMEVLVALLEVYENKHYPIGPADPIEAIKFRMAQQGLTPRDLEAFIGPSDRVSELMNGKRPLSLRMTSACTTAGSSLKRASRRGPLDSLSDSSARQNRASSLEPERTIRFRPSARATDYLLPPSVQDGLPQAHQARYAVDVADGPDLSEL